MKFRRNTLITFIVGLAAGWAVSRLPFLQYPDCRPPAIPREVWMRLEPDSLDKEFFGAGYPFRIVWDEHSQTVMASMETGGGGAISYVLRYSPFTGQMIPETEEGKKAAKRIWEEYLRERANRK